MEQRETQRGAPNGALFVVSFFFFVFYKFHTFDSNMIKIISKHTEAKPYSFNNKNIQHSAGVS